MAQRHPLIAQLVVVQQRESLTGVATADRIGISDSLYSRLVSGNVAPTVRVVRGIAHAFPELRDACAATVLGEDVEASPPAVAGAAT